MSGSIKITLQQLQHIAKLARIKLSAKEEKTFLPQLSSIFEYLDVLNKVDTGNIKPTFRVNEQKNVFRPDEIEPSLTQKEALSTAPRSKDGYFVVPGTIKK